MHRQVKSIKHRRTINSLLGILIGLCMLGSLFVWSIASEAALVSANSAGLPTGAEYQQFQELGAEIKRIRFGLEAPRGASFSAREYFTDDTKRIYYFFSVQFAKQAKEEKNFSVRAKFYLPSGQLFAEKMAHRFQIRPGSEEIHAYSYLDWQDYLGYGQASWPPGEYQVELLVDDLVVARDSFRITKRINSVGNRSGNLNNKGLVAQQGDWIYFASEEGALHRIKFNGQDLTRLTRDTALFINVHGAWAYFINDAKGEIISRVRIDGRGTEEVIAHDQASSLMLYDGWLYYINLSDQGKLYKVNLDGTKKVKLTDDAAHHFTIFDDTLFYVFDSGLDKDEEEERGVIYSLPITGGQRTLLTEDKAKGLVVADGWLYYINTSAKDALYRMSINGAYQEKLVDQPVIVFYADEELVYYQTNLNRGRIIYKLDLETMRTSQLETNMTRQDVYRDGRVVSEFPITYLNVANQWLYYSVDNLLLTNQYRLDTRYTRGGEKIEGIPEWEWRRLRF